MGVSKQRGGKDRGGKDRGGRDHGIIMSYRETAIR